MPSSLKFYFLNDSLKHPFNRLSPLKKFCLSIQTNFFRRYLINSPSLKICEKDFLIFRICNSIEMYLGFKIVLNFKLQWGHKVVCWYCFSLLSVQNYPNVFIYVDYIWYSGIFWLISRYSNTSSYFCWMKQKLEVAWNKNIQNAEFCQIVLESSFYGPQLNILVVKLYIFYKNDCSKKKKKKSF